MCRDFVQDELELNRRGLRNWSLHLWAIGSHGRSLRVARFLLWEAGDSWAEIPVHSL